MEIIIKGSDITFNLDGDISLENEATYKHQIINQLTLQDYKRIMIDMNKVDYIDSSGIGMFLYIDKFLRGKNNHLILKSVSESVMKMLKLGFFDQYFDIQ